MDEIFDICTTKIVSADFISIHFISLQSISIEQIPFQSISNHYKPFQLSRFHFKPFQSITIHFNSSKTASGPHAGPLLISPTNLDRKKNSSLLLAWFEMDCNELKWRLKHCVQISFQSITNHSNWADFISIHYKPFQLSRFHFNPLQSITIHFNCSKTASGPHAGPLLISPTNLDTRKVPP